MIKEKIDELIRQMTLEEKASLCSGKDFWNTKGIDRLEIPSSMVTDGPHGLRKQAESADHLGLYNSVKAVCFPAGCATAASFNRELLTKLGETIGNECQAENISVILGPAVNIKRSPLCGRNFEYFSEDPLLAAQMAGAYIKGVQSKGVGTSIKHFLANNQETRRMTSSSEIDERTLREIYLAAFEGAIKEAKPWTVMCSYNKINGTYAAENKRYLTDILRGEWGFTGYVMSDWGAVNSRVPDLAAGLDLEMPSSNGIGDALIVMAVKEGKLEEAVVDEACRRILNIVYQHQEMLDRSAVFDRDKDHETAKTIAYETIVLLKNEGILPLQQEDKVAFIGEYAKKPRYQGGGSSHINSSKVISAMEAVSGWGTVTYAQGFDEASDILDEDMAAKAIEAARAAKAAVVFAGLPEAYESEGYDRMHMRLPAGQNELIERIARVQSNIVVVLHNGSPVEMPWVGKVKGILEAYLSGQAVGEACVDILYGKVNPSAKLPETFPVKLEDNPSYLSFPGEGDRVVYNEGIFVGYRYYDKKKAEVLFPFGYGLSYTEFTYSNLTASCNMVKDTDLVNVSVDITNSGLRKGKEVVQLYVANPAGKAIRPDKELRDFTKVELEPGETKTVHFKLNKRAFAYWNTEIHDWYVKTGEYQILIGKSSREIVCSKVINVESTSELPMKFNMDSALGDILEHPRGKEFVKELMKGNRFFDEDILESKEAGANSVNIFSEMLKYLPVRGAIGFGDGSVTLERLQEFLDQMNDR